MKNHWLMRKEQRQAGYPWYFGDLIRKSQVAQQYLERQRMNTKPLKSNDAKKVQ